MKQHSKGVYSVTKDLNHDIIKLIHNKVKIILNK